MAILVTGGAGFVGLNLVEALLAREKEVVLFDRGELPSAAERILAPQRTRFVLINGDVLNAAALNETFRTRRIDRILHCAAVTSGPAREAREPAAIAEVNIKGTINVLEAARRAQVKRIVVTSSGAVYGEASYRLPRLDEDTPPVPVSLYGITKYAAERTCVRLRELWQIDAVCARLGTVIGPWERDTGVRDNFGTHSQLARLALKGETVVLPQREVQRDWVYSCDVAAGLIALLDAPAPRYPVYNLASGKDWRGNVAAWCEALRADYPKFRYRTAAPGEQPNVSYTDKDRGLMEVGRIAQDIGFTPRFGPREAFADYLQWLKRAPDFWDRAE